MTFIINPRNKQEEKIVMAFLNSLNINFYFEIEEDAVLVNAIQKGRKTALLTKAEKADFLKQAGSSKRGNNISKVKKLKKHAFDVNADLKKAVI